MYDLHTHSTFSDGTTSPAQNAAMTAAAGLDGFALTDHDTVDGWRAAAEACAAYGLAFVPGIELSTEHGDRGVHVLGYWVDPNDPALAAECARLRTERERRAAAMVARLNAVGLGVTMARVQALAHGAPIGRPHLAAALVELGAVPDTDAAFERYIGDGADAYEPKRALSPERGIELVVGAGGVAVLAHPGLGSRQAAIDLELLDRLVAAGLAGVEADHSGHDDDTRRRWRAAAGARGLLVTGSSDFHGRQKESKIGDATTTGAVVRALRAATRPLGDLGVDLGADPVTRRRP